MLWFKKEVGVDIKKDQEDMEENTDEEYMGDINLDDEREHHWRMLFEENDGGVDYKKAFLHAKRWDGCVNEN